MRDDFFEEYRLRSKDVCFKKIDDDKRCFHLGSVRSGGDHRIPPLEHFSSVFILVPIASTTSSSSSSISSSISPHPPPHPPPHHQHLPHHHLPPPPPHLSTWIVAVLLWTWTASLWVSRGERRGLKKINHFILILTICFQ